MTSTPIVQIYEIQEPAEAEAVIALGVDHVGSVIVSDATWRIGTVRDTVRCVQDAGARSSLIPLYRDPDTVYRTLDYYTPDIVHFCDILETTLVPELIALQEGVRRRFPGIAIMRSIPIAASDPSDGRDALAFAEEMAPVSDWFLTDTLMVNGADGTGEQPVNGFVGITGTTCDWESAARLVAATAVPVILAGGLGPDNVVEGIRATRPAGVDSCTLTNARDAGGRPIRFKKDLMAVARFVTEAKRAAATL